MEKHKKMIPYLIVNIIAFYVLPIIISDTGTAMFVMLVGIPFICFITAMFFGAKNPFTILYPIIVALLFAPTIFIFYNSTASFYIIQYGVIALLGCLVGKSMYKGAK